MRTGAGERFPADGTVVSNAALVDEQAFTGESRPVLKQAGDRVVGGTLNLDGDLTIVLTEFGENDTLARVVELVRRARQSKGRYQRLADRIASHFVPAVSAIAIVAFGTHWMLGSFERGLWAGLAVALIACPCALGLAAPLAIWSAVGNAAGRGVLFRSGEAVEQLAEISAIRFDKTGTLTTVLARVAHYVPESPGLQTLALTRAAALAEASSHAMSKAIVDFVHDQRVATCHEILGARVVPGIGVTGNVSLTGEPVFLGSWRFAREQRLSVGQDLVSCAGFLGIVA